MNEPKSDIDAALVRMIWSGYRALMGELILFLAYDCFLSLVALLVRPVDLFFFHKNEYCSAFCSELFEGIV